MLTKALSTPTATPESGLAQSVRVAAGANNLLQQWRRAVRTFVCYGNKDPMATPNARAVAPTLRRKVLRRC